MYRILAFFTLLVFWLLLSGKFDLFHLTLGIISCLIIAQWTKDLFLRKKAKGISVYFLILPKFIAYSFWLLLQIIKANLSVIYLALHPRMINLLDPCVIRFKTILKNDFAKVVLANSITLTPGTITIRIEGDEFVVHALTEKIAAGAPGDMENRIANVFKDFS